jgi:hypothetical protein
MVGGLQGIDRGRFRRLAGPVGLGRSDVDLAGTGHLRFRRRPLTIEVHDRSPPPLADDAESVGEFDLTLPSGELVMEESGGGSDDNAVILPQGEWRARWSGFGEAAAEERDGVDTEEGKERPDRYAFRSGPGPSLQTSLVSAATDAASTRAYIPPLSARTNTAGHRPTYQALS